MFSREKCSHPELLYSTADELCKQYKAEHVVIDETGLGGPIVEALKNRIGSRVQVTGFTFGGTTKVPLINRLVLRLEQGHFKFKDVPELRRQLLLYQWDDTGLMTDAVMMAALTAETANVTGMLAWMRQQAAAKEAEAAAKAAQEAATA